MNVLLSLLNQYSLSPDIKSFVLYMSNGIDITKYIKPLKLGLKDLLSSFGSNISFPIHDALNDAINLSTLYDVLKSKRIVSRLMKITTNGSSLNEHYQKQLAYISPDLLAHSFTKERIKSSKEPMKRQFMDVQTKEIFSFNVYKQKEVFETVCEMKIPRIIHNSHGLKREIAIYIIENINSKTQRFPSSIEKIAEFIGIESKVCEQILKDFVSKGYIERVSEIEYVLSQNLYLPDKGNFRRVLCEDKEANKFQIIY